MANTITSTPLGVGHLALLTGLSSGWPDAAQEPKFKIPLLDVLSQDP